jgi:uncharacterized protein
VQVSIVSEAELLIRHQKIAREEFPNYDVTVRGSVSIEKTFRSLAELLKLTQKPLV